MPSPAPLLYLVTDRRQLGDDPASFDALVRLAADAASAGVDMIQVRERDLDARALASLCHRLRGAVAPSTRLLVNDRADVALAAGCDGVHLTTRSMRPRVVRDAVGERLLVGVSTHSAREIAASEGADFAVCGPVFETPSKSGLGEPLGVERLAELASSAPLPIVAIGGITRATALAPFAAPIAGIAAIRLFHDAWREGGRDGLRRLVDEIRALRP